MTTTLEPRTLVRCALLALAIAAGHGASAQKKKEAWEYLQEPAFKSAYLAALGPMAKSPWLAKRDGPAPQDKFITVAGERYVMNSFCRNHACDDHSAVVLYSPEKKIVYGTVYEKGRTTLIGAPPAGLGAELAKLWKAEWRTPAK